MKFRPNISAGDLHTKTVKILSMLGKGSRVKVIVVMRGREASHPDLARMVLDKVIAATSDVGRVHSESSDSRSVTAVLYPRPPLRGVQ